MSRGPKSHHADGTPKKRWTAEQRAARGRGPRKRGGQGSGEEPRNRAERRAQQFSDDRGERRGKQPFNSRWDDRGERRGPQRGKGPRAGKFGGGKPRRSRHDEAPGVEVGLRFHDDFREERRDDRPRKRFDREDRPRKQWDRRDDDRPRKRFDRDDRPRKQWEGRDVERPRKQWDRRDDDRPRKRFDRDDRSRKQWDRRDDRGDGGRRFDRDERRKPWQRDERRDHFDRRDRDEAPEADQMAWEATTVEATEHVTNGFSELGVAHQMVDVLAAQGITQPFAIQEATIRDGIAGRDVLGRARTGSGKTLAFGLAMLTRLAEGRGRGPRAVVLSPTRELALQIADNLAPLARAVGLDLTLVAGGMSYNPQIKAFERGVDVVVATPGRLVDLMQQGAADLSNVEISVLDEADHMAEMGFTDEVTAILDATPADGQRLLFSATLDEAVDRIVRQYLHDPVTHEVDSGQASVTTMTHLALQVKPHLKTAVFADIASREGKTVVFARTQKGTDRIAGQLRDAGVMAGALHGGLTQGARARILAAFKSGDVPVLVATDVAARGIHVDDVTLVLQVDPPRDSKDYLHRAGRTARAGTDGTVATIVLPHQRKMMRRILGQAGVDARNVEGTPGDEELVELTGATAATHEAIDERDYLELIKPKQAQRKPGGGRKQFRRRGGWKRR